MSAGDGAGAGSGDDDGAVVQDLHRWFVDGGGVAEKVRGGLPPQQGAR